jgi:hypothetical protein
MPRLLYRIYVDETGDRGWGGRSSPIFVLSAIIVRDGYEQSLVGALDTINQALKKPPATVLHWAENIKTHSQRKFVTRQIASLDMTIASVIVFKNPLMGSHSALSDPASMYNYAIRRLLERVSWFVDDAGGKASVTFAHVRRFPYERLRQYIGLLKASPTQIRWQALTGNPKINQPSRIRPLQVADLVAGAHGSALRPDDFGAFESSYLLELVPRIYIRGSGRVTSYGFNVIGPSDHIKTYPWWATFETACRARQAKRGAGPA